MSETTTTREDLQTTTTVIELERGWSEIREQGIDRLRGILEQDVNDVTVTNNSRNADSPSEKPKLIFPRDEAGKVYTIVYGMCHQPAPYDWSNELFDRYRKEVEHYLSSTVAPGLTESLANTSNPVLFLNLLATEWERFEFFAKWMNAFFRVLDRPKTLESPAQSTSFDSDTTTPHQPTQRPTLSKRPSLTGPKRPTITQVAMDSWETIILNQPKNGKNSKQQTHNQDAMGAMMELIRCQRVQALDKALGQGTAMDIPSNYNTTMNHRDDPHVVQFIKKMHQMYTTLDYRNTIGRGSTRNLIADNRHQQQWQEQLLAATRQFYSKLREEWRNPSSSSKEKKSLKKRPLSLAGYFELANRALELETARTMQYIDQMIIAVGAVSTASTSNILSDAPQIHESTISIAEHELFEKAHLQIPASHVQPPTSPPLEKKQQPPPLQKESIPQKQQGKVRGRMTRRSSLSRLIPKPVHRIFQRRSSLSNNTTKTNRRNSNLEPKQSMSHTDGSKSSSSLRALKMKAFDKPLASSARTLTLNDTATSSSPISSTLTMQNMIDTTRWRGENSGIGPLSNSDNTMLAMVKPTIPDDVAPPVRARMPRRPSLKMSSTTNDNPPEPEDEEDEDDSSGNHSLEDNSNQNIDWILKQRGNMARRDSGDFHASLGMHIDSSELALSEKNDASHSNVVVDDDDDDEEEDEDEEAEAEIFSTQRERDEKRQAFLKKKLMEAE